MNQMYAREGERLKIDKIASKKNAYNLFFLIFMQSYFLNKKWYILSASLKTLIF